MTITNTVRGLALVAICLGLSACKVNKTQDAKLPKVQVTAAGGQLPKFSVEGPKVDVGTKTETIKVPTVHVTTPDHK